MKSISLCLSETDQFEMSQIGCSLYLNETDVSETLWRRTTCYRYTRNFVEMCHKDTDPFETLKRRTN